MAARSVGGDDSPRTLREIVQKKFLDDVFGVIGGEVLIFLFILILTLSNNFIEKWKVLVLDDESTRVISSALTMFDIMERRVTIVENLFKSRQPFPEMDVVYFITPKESSINALLADFADPRKQKYGSVHIVFSDAVSDNTIIVMTFDNEAH